MININSIKAVDKSKYKELLNDTLGDFKDSPRKIIFFLWMLLDGVFRNQSGFSERVV
jgi:hypothetical protein